MKPVFLCLSKHLSLFLNHAIIDRYYVYNIHKYAFLGLHYLMSAHKLLFLAHLIVGYMPYTIILMLLHRPKVDYFCHPMGIWSSLKIVIGFKEYTDDDQAYKVVQSDRDPNREVFICSF